MRIAFSCLAGVAPLRIGGPAEVARQLVTEYARQGHEVSFFVGTPTGDAAEVRAALRLPESVEVVAFPKEPQGVRGAPGEAARALRATASLWRRRPDVLHVCSAPHLREVPLMASARLRGVPQAFSYHGWLSRENDWFLPPARARRENAWTRSYLRRMDAVVVNSEFMRPLAVGDGAREERVRVIPNGISLDEVPPSDVPKAPGSPSILFVGRLEEVKGVDLLMEAFLQVRRERPDASLHLVGTGALEGRLRAMAAEAKAEDAVTFHGFVGAERKMALYRACDLGVMPSRYEPFGITILEALASGLPLVTTTAGGVPEITAQGTYAAQVEPDADALRDAILGLWRSDEARARLREAGPRRAREYAWSRIARSYLDLYETLGRR